MNLILYPEDSSHSLALDIIRKNYDYALCLHDLDLSDEGEIKKAHYHVVVRFGNARSSQSVANELGIQHNYIEQCHNLNASLLYLIHFNNADKHQYTISCVEGTLKNKLETLLSGEKDEGEDVLQLLSLLEGLPPDITYTEFLKQACKAGLWSQFRKLGFGAKLILDDHRLLN